MSFLEKKLYSLPPGSHRPSKSHAFCSLIHSHAHMHGKKILTHFKKMQDLLNVLSRLLDDT